MKYPRNTTCYIKIILIPYCFLLISCARAEKPKQYVTFLEKLTSNKSDWKNTDFGKIPTSLEKELLSKFAPSFWLDKNSCGPMDFYEQYVPLLSFKDHEKTIIGSRSSLKEHERNFKVLWQLKDKPNCIQSPTPPLYAYSWKEQMQLPSGKEMSIRILKYAFSFYKSGLPVKQTILQKFGFILGSQDHWHYLDIHGAIFYLLNKNNEPFAMVLAQHNHFRSFIIENDVTLKESKNICYSIRSNEPYICNGDQGPFEFATAPTFQDIQWIISKKNKPFLGAWDIIPKPTNRKKIIYHIKFLTKKDPLITSWNSLGPELKIWGLFSTFYRKSPPGMAIFNIPQLKEIWKTAQYFYFDATNAVTFRLHEENTKDFFNPKIEKVLKINALRFEKSLINNF